MKKDYSFDKKKVIDVEAVEKSTDGKAKVKKLSFSEKLKIAGERIHKATEKYEEFQQKAHVKNIAKLKKNVEKTNLEAQLAKNKSKIEKYTKKKDSKEDPFGFKEGFF